MKRVIIIALMIITPLLVYSQYIDIGYRASKFNQGIAIKSLFNLYEVNNPCGVEIFGGYSFIGKDGYVASISFIKQWGLSNSIKSNDIFLVTQIGIGGGLFKDFYSIVDGKKVDYPNYITPSLNINSHFGFEWISQDIPFSLLVTCNPWYDFLNKGPEVIDLNLTLKFQFKEY